MQNPTRSAGGAQAFGAPFRTPHPGLVSARQTRREAERATLAELRCDDTRAVISKVRAFYREHPRAAWGVRDLAAALGCTPRWLWKQLRTLTLEGQLISKPDDDLAPYELAAQAPLCRSYVPPKDQGSPSPVNSLSLSDPSLFSPSSRSGREKRQADRVRPPVITPARARGPAARSPAPVSIPPRKVRRAHLQPDRPAPAPPSGLRRGGARRGPVPVPDAALAAVRAVFGDDAETEVRAVLWRDLAHVDPAATVLALRTLPWRQAHNPGGHFVDLIRAALRGEPLVERDAERARTRAAEQAARNRGMAGVELDELDDRQLAEELELLVELARATETHDKLQHRRHVAELARVRAAVNLRPAVQVLLDVRKRRRQRRSSDPWVAPERMTDRQLADYAAQLFAKLDTLPEGDERARFERTSAVVQRALDDRPKAARLVAARVQGYAPAGSATEADELLRRSLAEMAEKLGDE